MDRKRNDESKASYLMLDQCLKRAEDIVDRLDFHKKISSSVSNSRFVVLDKEIQDQIALSDAINDLIRSIKSESDRSSNAENDPREQELIQESNDAESQAKERIHVIREFHERIDSSIGFIHMVISILVIVAALVALIEWSIAYRLAHGEAFGYYQLRSKFNAGI